MMNKHQQHTLNDKWDLYYHLPNDRKWNLESYTVISKDISNAEDIIAINNALTDNIVKKSMLFLMRKGITPLWEDPSNRNGGCFSFIVSNKIVKNVWTEMSYLLCGETLTVSPEHTKHINGITISPKTTFCVIKIWLDTMETEYQNVHIIRDITNLSKDGCIFKKHSPEF
jgi:hypothetical protein